MKGIQGGGPASGGLAWRWRAFRTDSLASSSVARRIAPSFGATPAEAVERTDPRAAGYQRCNAPHVLPSRNGRKRKPEEVGEKESWRQRGELLMPNNSECARGWPMPCCLMGHAAAGIVILKKVFTPAVDLVILSAAEGSPAYGRCHAKRAKDRC